MRNEIETMRPRRPAVLNQGASESGIKIGDGVSGAPDIRVGESDPTGHCVALCVTGYQEPRSGMGISGSLPDPLMI